MARNKLVDMIGRLSEEQVERLSEIAMEYLDLNTEFEDTAPQVIMELQSQASEKYKARAHLKSQSNCIISTKSK